MRLRWLGTGRLTWCELRTVVHQLPRTSALYRARVGDEASAWAIPERMLTYIFARMTSLLSAWTDDPAAFALPHVPGDPAEPETPEGPMHWGGEPVSIEEMNQTLGWNQPVH